MTAKELNLIARTVFAEAATEGIDGQMAVAQAMYDQLYHNIIGADGSGFGHTVESVIQNAFTKPTEQDIRGSSCMEAAIRVFMEHEVIFPNHYVYFFMSDRGSSYWRDYWNSHYVQVAKLKNHTFWGIEVPENEKETRVFHRFLAEISSEENCQLFEYPGVMENCTSDILKRKNGDILEILGVEKGTDNAAWYLAADDSYAGYIRADRIKRKKVTGCL